jgi:Cu/Ag efflux pump CusA
VPLVLLGDRPGHEIEYPLAVVILGGLSTSTLLNLFIIPSLICASGAADQCEQRPVTLKATLIRSDGVWSG